MRIGPLVLLMGLAALTACAAKNHDFSPATIPAPRFTPGSRILPQAGSSDSGSTATLVVRLFDLRGEALPFALVSLPEVRMGLLTNEAGSGRSSGIPPGDWCVRWRVVGAIPPGIDSTRVHFEPGRAETLEVHLAMWHEPRMDIWDGRTPLPKRPR